MKNTSESIVTHSPLTTNPLVKVPHETDREGLNFDKIQHFLGVMLGNKTANADAFLNSFDAFDVEMLRELTGKSITNVLLDIDGCIAPPYGPIISQNLAHIDNLKRKGVNFGVYSNCKSMDRLNPLREMDVPVYDGHRAKPAAAGFIEVCLGMNFDPSQTWMVDDNPLTGGGAVGVLEGMAFVNPIQVDKRYVPSRSKRVKLALSGILRGFAIQRTLQNNPQMHRLSPPP